MTNTGYRENISGPDDLSRVFSVSRETVDRLKIYESALVKWQETINLVAPKTIDAIWSRHFADSLQLAGYVPEASKKLVDLGSGGGFPGLVIAAHFADISDLRVTLVESDQRKCAFLREAARLMEISVEIKSTRIENDANLSAFSDVDVFTARALAPLRRLLELIAPHMNDHTQCIFMKGREVGREIEQAKEGWRFEISEHPSLTDADARILVIGGVASARIST